MKKTHSMLAMLLVLALLVSLTAVTVSAAGETVTNTLDFSTLSVATEDMTAAAEAIRAVGAIEVSNLIAADCHTKFVAGKGYAGEGYYVQKLEAGTGKLFAKAPVLTLNYRLTAAESLGYIKVQASVDGVTYTDFATLNQATGAGFDVAAKASTTVTLSGVEGHSTVWVKISMQHWSSPDGAGVDASSVTAEIKDDPNYVPADALSSVIDFTAMNATEDKSAAKDMILAAGAVAADNLFVRGNHEPIANPGGYNGAGYFVQKLEAGEGKVLKDVKLSLDYWLATGDPQGYIEVYASTDNENFEKVFEQREGNGDPFQASTKQNKVIGLTEAAGQAMIYVKVVVEHWNTYEGAAVSRSALVGYAVNAGTPADPEDNPPKTGDTSLLTAAVVSLLCCATAVVALKKKEQ